MTAPDLRIEWMRLDDLVPARRNTRTHDLPAIGAAIRELGFFTQFQIDESTGELVWGHGRLAELRRMRDDGADPPEGVRVDPDDPGEWMVPVVRGWSSRDSLHADAVREADNAVAQTGGFDAARQLDVLGDLAAERPDYLRGTGRDSDYLDRLLAESSGGTERTELDPPSLAAPWDREEGDDSDRGSMDRSSGHDEQWQPGDDPDEGSSREPEGPGPLDVEPAWRTLDPLRARYHDGTPDGAQAVARWLKGHATDVHVRPDLGVTWRGRDGEDYLPPGKWLTRYRGALDVLTREEFEDEFVPANEPARRAQRDAAPVTRPGADLLRHGTGVVTAAHTAGSG